MTFKNPLAAAPLLLAIASLPLTGLAAPFTVTSGTPDSTAKTLTGNGTGTVQATGILSISDGTTAVNITGTGTVTVEYFGSILQTGSGRAIDNAGGGNSGARVINNNADALIRTANSDVIRINRSDSDVTINSGIIRPLNSSAVATRLLILPPS